jgi:integrase
MEHCRVDLAQAPRTVANHRVLVRLFLNSSGWVCSEEAFREFLSGVENPNTRNNYIKSVRQFSRFMGSDITDKFKYAPATAPVRPPLSRKELREFYEAIGNPMEEAMFLLYATTGRRRLEILSLKMGEIDQESRALMPNHQSRTKNTWYSFYNQEAADALGRWLEVRTDPKGCGKLFQFTGSNFSGIWAKARHRTGLEITPQSLRFWFANEMARLGVPDRFIDAYQGRVPRSILARHYSDYSLENLKSIYDKAALKVLA